MRILLIGGAGYIGSQLFLDLCDRGHKVTVFDDLSTGRKWDFLGDKLINGDICDFRCLIKAIQSVNADAVIHLAGISDLRESLSNPSKYLRTNSLGTLNVAEACTTAGVRYLVFSSSAAVYGALSTGLISEKAPINPISPYGVSKALSETIINEISKVGSLNCVSLRYFNVAGADTKGRVGEINPKAWHLVKVVCEAAIGSRDEVKVFGTDFETPDGTCVRDFVHVEDVSSAHSSALEYLMQGGESCALNVGYGRGVSVMEVVQAVKKISQKDFLVLESHRRDGDPPILVADSSELRSRFGWRPKFDSLETIVTTALAWEKKLISCRASIPA